MRGSKFIVSSLAAGFIGVTELAQTRPAESPRPPGESPTPPPQRERERSERGERGPRGGSQLTPEQAKAAWETQAKFVAKQLTLNAEQTALLTTAYLESRQRFGPALEQARREANERAARERAEGAGGDAPDARPAQSRRFLEIREELAKAERDKLQTALAKSLSSEQVTKALVPLGAFNPTWDSMVNLLSGFKLDERKTDQALAATQAYVVELAKAQAGDPAELASAFGSARRALIGAVTPLLDEEQLEQFQESIRPGRGAPGRGGERPQPPATRPEGRGNPGAGGTPDNPGRTGGG
jgi:hypothetical protein